MKLSFLSILALFVTIFALSSVNSLYAEGEEETIESAEGDGSVPIYDSSDEGAVEEDGSADVEE